jgi:peptidoglycan/LPS O-acetylase OafA/YrhL
MATILNVLYIGMMRTLYDRLSERAATILIAILICLLLGAVPLWPHSRNWGYFPSATLCILLLIIIILVRLRGI